MKNKRQNERLDRMSDALFGAPEDVSLADAIENLKAVGIEPEDLCKRMYDKLCLVAQSYRLRKEELPSRLRKAMEDLRPDTLPARNREDLDRAANSTVSRILDAVKGPLTLASSMASLTLNPSFRNKAAEQPPEDRRIIDRLEKELLNDLENEEKENQK